MKYLFLMTLIMTTSAFGRVKIKLSDLGKINYDQTMIEVQSDRDQGEFEAQREESEVAQTKLAQTQKFQQKTGKSTVPVYSPFTKFNSESQSWEGH
jgi:hypothetical protein